MKIEDMSKAIKLYQQYEELNIALEILNKESKEDDIETKIFLVIKHGGKESLINYEKCLTKENIHFSIERLIKEIKAKFESENFDE